MATTYGPAFPETRKQWRFFLNHAGWANPPGRAACALSLARAEQRAEQDEEIRFRWERDDVPDTSWCSDRDMADLQAGRTEILCCFLDTWCDQCGDWRVQDVLGGIHVLAYDDNYRRVVEAQMAAEYYSR